MEVFTVNFLAACCDAFSIPVRELAALGGGAKVDSCCETDRYLPNDCWGFFRNQHWNFNAKISIITAVYHPVAGSKSIGFWILIADFARWKVFTFDSHWLIDGRLNNQQCFFCYWCENRVTTRKQICLKNNIHVSSCSFLSSWSGHFEGLLCFIFRLTYYLRSIIPMELISIYYPHCGSTRPAIPYGIRLLIYSWYAQYVYPHVPTTYPINVSVTVNPTFIHIHPMFCWP